MAKHFAHIEEEMERGSLKPIPTISQDDSGNVGKHSAELPTLRSSYSSDGLKRVRHKRTKQKNPVLIGLAIFAGALVLALGALGYWLFTLNNSMSISDDERDALREALVVREGNDGMVEGSSAFYALIVGSDSRNGLDGARGDVMMLCRIDPDAGTVHLISIPRDTMITLGSETAKINAAFAYGGAAGAVTAVSLFAGVPISHYVEVDFEGLVDVVDLVGGVWVNIPEPFSAGGYYFDAGEQLLDGEQALIYARQRYAFTGGDFTRSQSQRQIVQGVIDKILSASPSELPGIAGALARMVSTDYSVTDIASLALQFREHGVRMYSTICPSYTLWQNETSYVGTMYKEWAELMKRVDAGLDPNDPSVPIPEPQASNADLGAATNAASPHDYYGLVDEAGLTTGDIDSPQ